MKFWYQQPLTELADVVRTMLLIEGFSESAPTKVPLFTSGMPAFVCRTTTIEDKVSVELLLFGKSVPDDFWQVTPTSTIVAFFFKPFVLPALFDVAVTDLPAEGLDLGLWQPQKANALRTQLAYADATAAKLEVLTNLLCEQRIVNKKHGDIILYATDKMMQDSTPEVLAEILIHLGLTERTFQRIFKKYVGISPGHYRRICQFQLSFSQLRAKAFNALSDVAFDSGFADQSHFIRSFKEFTQTTPNDYLKSGLKKKK